MGENKRRSEVKRFLHNKAVVERTSGQRSLFDEALRNNRDWLCTLKEGVNPASGSTVFVKTNKHREVSVSLGNQQVAKITGQLGNELTSLLWQVQSPNDLCIARLVVANEEQARVFLHFGE